MGTEFTWGGGSAAASTFGWGTASGESSAFWTLLSVEAGRALPFAGDGRSEMDDLVDTCHILAFEGHGTGLSGQVSMRVDDGLIVTQKLGFGLSEVSKESTLTINKELEVIFGNGIPNPANRFHFSIYDFRPEIKCVVHTHPFYSSAVSILGKPLLINHMDHMILYGITGFINSWPGVPISFDEGDLFCGYLRDKDCLLLSNHGLLVLGKTVREACVRAVAFERAAKLHLATMSIENISLVEEKLAAEARSWLSSPARINATFQFYRRMCCR